jgi:hypothetical protein
VVADGEVSNEQGLKPAIFFCIFGPAEAVPLLQNLLVEYSPDPTECSLVCCERIVGNREVSLSGRSKFLLVLCYFPSRGRDFIGERKGG